MGSVGNLVTTGLGCNSLIESGLVGVDAFDIALEQGVLDAGASMRKNSGIPLRSTCLGCIEKATTGCASDCPKKDFGRRAARSGTPGPGHIRAGYAEIFRV